MSDIEKGYFIKKGDKVDFNEINEFISVLQDHGQRVALHCIDYKDDQYLLVTCNRYDNPRSILSAIKKSLKDQKSNEQRS